MTASRGMCMMQMHYFYEISKSGLVSRTKGSGWPESRGGLALFTELPGRVLHGNPDPYARMPIRYRGVWGRHVCSASFLVSGFSEIQLVLCSAARTAPSVGYTGLSTSTPLNSHNGDSPTTSSTNNDRFWY